MKYLINPQFCLDDGTPMGVNVQLYSREEFDTYWDSEQQFDTMVEALEFTKGMTRHDVSTFQAIQREMIDKMNYLPTNHVNMKKIMESRK